MKSIPARHCLAALACAICAGVATIAAAAGVPISRWQCAPTGASAMAPALAEAASEYLGRVEALYPHQVLGLVRAGDRFYLLNSRDIEWSERTRLDLLALRLRESYLTAERQAGGATPGSSPPPGGFICLAASRAEREGLARSPFGEIVLAAGQSVHLVDPQEPQVAVEVRAAQDRPLNLGEIFHRSARAGIYAGLTWQARQPGDPATLQRPVGTLIYRMASAGGSAVETRVATLEGAGGGGEERQATSPSAAQDTVVAAVRTSTEPESARREPARQDERVREKPLLAPAVPPLLPSALPEKVTPTAPPREQVAVQSPPIPEQKPAPAAAAAAVTPVGAPAPQQSAEHAAPVPLEIVAATAPPESAAQVEGVSTAAAAAATIPIAAVLPAVPASVTPASAPTGVSVPREITARVGPASAGQHSAGVVPNAARPIAGQPYDDYARAMRTMMALRRSGGVRSVSEMTYVHPAVEVLRPLLR